MEMAVMKVPIICIVIGEGASGGALGIGIGDRVYMMENTWYSVISPESCSSILWRSWENKEQAAEALRLSASDNLDLKIIDGIIEEPLGGAHKDPEAAYENVKKQIISDLHHLSQRSAHELISDRIDKFSQMGVYNDVSLSNNPNAEVKKFTSGRDEIVSTAFSERSSS